MKSLLIFTFLAGAGYLGWRTGGSLDSDAMGMAVGIVLGVGAAIPTALLLLAAGRRRDAEETHARAARRAHARNRRQSQHQGLPAHSGYAPQQPPVIVLAGAGMQPGAQSGHFGPQPMGMSGWGEARPERRFKLVGEQEAWIDEW